jgi:myosin-5
MECRFEETMKSMESSLTFEKQQHEASLVELVEAREKIEELQREVGDTDEKSTLLQTAVQRFFFSSLCKNYNILCSCIKFL